MSNKQISNSVQNATTQTSTKPKKPREGGIEALRIFAIFLITCVHMLNFGGFFANTQSAFELATLRLLYAFFMIAVNIFVIITGFFMVKSKYRPEKLLPLWFSVLFYGFFLEAVAIFVFGAELKMDDFWATFFPITNNRYWFFTSYALLFLISPLLNLVLLNATKKQLNWVMVGVLAFSFAAKRFNVDEITQLVGGYNLMWFICLYFVGGYLNLHMPNLKRYQAFLIYFATTLGLWGCFYIREISWFIDKFIVNKCEYTAPLSLIASVAIFLSVKGIMFNEKVTKFITFLSSAVFGIYLFQEAFLFKPFLYENILHTKDFWGRDDSILYLFRCVLIVCVLGFLTDMIRQILFKIFAILKAKIWAKS